MRVLVKIVAVTALVLGVVGTARATIIGSIPNGPIVITYVNWDTGTLYGVDNGLYQGEKFLDDQFQIRPDGGMGSEDSWGIFRVDAIYDITQMITYYDRWTSSVEITGIVWGERDTYLNQTEAGSPPTLTQDIHGIGVYAAFFEDDTPDFNPRQGPGARLPDGTYPTATDGDLIWTFKSVPGWNTTFPSDEFFTTFRPNATIGDTSANGGMFAALSTVPVFGTGSLNEILDPNGIAPGVAARMDFTGRVGTDGWLVNSNDPVLVTIIPEPVTMLMLSMGIAGLGSYVYKRRKS